MRLIGRMFAIVFALLIALLIGAYFFLQDANRLKPELAALVAEHTSYRASFNGDITWQLFPPLQLRIEDVVLEREDERIRAGELDLKMDLSAID